MSLLQSALPNRELLQSRVGLAVTLSLLAAGPRSRIPILSVALLLTGCAEPESQATREQAIDGFKSGEFEILVATDIAGRGIDVEGVGRRDTRALREELATIGGTVRTRILY